jgi:UDPglucose 6-dehydrogenase
MDEAHKIFKDKIVYAENQYEALKKSDALIIVTDWNEFRNPDFEKLSKYLKNKIIFDGRNLLSLKEIKKNKFTYYRVGLKPIISKK